MKIFIKIEYLINKLLLWMIEKSLFFIQKHTPTRIKARYNQGKVFKNTIIFKLKNTPIVFIKNILNRIKQFIFNIKEVIKQLNIKEKALIIIKSLKALVHVFTINNFKFQLLRIKNTFSGVYSNIEKRIPLGAKWGLKFGIISIMIIIYFINKEYESIYKKLHPIMVAKKEKKYVHTIRPDYFRREFLYFDLNEVNIPIYVTGHHSMKLLIIDMVIESSNRFIPQYFLEYEHEIRDHLYTHLEPVIPGFPLKKEGKRILRNKLIVELNKYLNKKNIKGEVKSIYIQGIIAD